MPSRLLYPDWLAHRAATTPARTALVAGGREWSFAELDAEVSALARHLSEVGVAADDRVATLLHNGPLAAMIVHATLRLGATLVPLNRRLGAAEIAWQVGDAAPRVLVVEGRTAGLADEARRAQPAVRVVSAEELTETVAVTGGVGATPGGGSGATESGEGAGGPPRITRYGRTPESAQPSERTAKQTNAPALRLAHPAGHVLAIIYTSGTTGRPKGAMLTVGNFWWSATGSALNLGVHVDDRWLACLPLFHVGGLSILIRSAIHGIAAVVHDGFDEHAVNRAIDDERITIVSVVAVMLQRLLDARDGRAFPPTLRCVLLGGGPTPRPLLERAAAMGVPVVQTYGLTETTSQLATLAPEDALRKLGSSGRALYPNEVRIDARPDDQSGAGEILVRGPVVMAGYAGRPDDTARAIVDGWLHTGDIGRIDDEGFLHVLDRRDDLVITGGENVYPAEVEAALLAHPMVAEAAVIGAPDEKWGQRVVAVVRLAAGADASAAPDVLRAHCRASLAAYKAPREVIVVTEPLPRTASGKLQRSVVRGRFA